MFAKYKKSYTTNLRRNLIDFPSSEGQGGLGGNTLSSYKVRKLNGNRKIQPFGLLIYLSAVKVICYNFDVKNTMLQMKATVTG